MRLSQRVWQKDPSWHNPVLGTSNRVPQTVLSTSPPVPETRIIELINTIAELDMAEQLSTQHSETKMATSEANRAVDFVFSFEYTLT